jgi:peptidoglycan/LPS O-acetylase OafA/YrhL
MTWPGVDLFFVLSGFLIGGILMQNRKSETCYRTFYLRRLWRILPLYSIVLGLALALGSQTVLWRLPELRPIFAYELPAHTFFLQVQNIAMAVQGKFAQQALTVTWPLALEEQFYLILPLVVRIFSPRQLPWSCVAFVVSAPIIRIGLHSVSPEDARFWSYVSLPPARWADGKAPFFALAKVASTALHQPSASLWKQFWPEAFATNSPNTSSARKPTTRTNSTSTWRRNTGSK